MVDISDIELALSRSDDFSSYYDTEEDRVVVLSEYDDIEEEAEDRELVDADEKDRFIQIENDVLDNHEWECMRDFAGSVDDEDKRDQLVDAISGTGAFRMFRSTVRRLGMEDEWHAFENASERRRAVEWCEDHGVPYELPKSE